MYRFWASASTVGTAHVGQTSQPTRQPVMPNVLEKLLITNASSVAARTVDGATS